MTFIITDEQKKGIPEPTQEDLDNIIDIVSENKGVVQTDAVKAAKKRVKKRKGTSFGYENKIALLKQTTRIFEIVKKTRINLELKSYALQNRAQVYDGYDDLKHYITVGKSEEENVKTSLERALSYVAFDTSKKQFLDKQLELSTFAQSKHKSIADNLTHSVYASLEAHRVHSCMGHVFKGFDERYSEADKLIAKKEFTNNPDFKINDPVTALQCAQLGLDDLVKKSEFPEANQYIKDVERTSPAGSVILTEKFVEDVLAPWYLKNFQEPEDGGTGGEGKGEGEPDPNAEGKTDQVGEGKGTPDYDKPHKQAKDWKGKKPTDRQTGYLDRLGYDGKVPETRGGTSDLISKLKDPADSTPDEPNQFDPVNDEKDNELADLNQDITDHRKNTNSGEQMTGKAGGEDTSETLEEAQEKGEHEIEMIENSIADIGAGNNDDDTARKITWKKVEIEQEIGEINILKNLPVIAQPQVDQQTVNRLKQVFKKIKSKPKTEVSDSGSEIDVDLFIKDECEGATDFMVEDVEQQGFAVVIGIDESGSMGGTPIQIARNLCGTLYKAFENMPNVEIHVVGWQSSGRKCDIHLIRKFSEVGTLHSGGGTPFRKATLYLTEYVRKLPQKKKLFFQITDGGISYDERTKNYLNEMKQKTGTVVTGMLIGYYGGGDPAMEDLFGKKNFLKFNSMDDVKKVLIDDITKTFVRYMKC